MQSSNLKSNVLCVEPVWGQRHGEKHGNWTRQSSHIKCRADAVGAMVYIFGDEKILAHCIEDACVTLQEQKLESLKKELKAFQWELNELDIAMAEIEDEIENKQLEIRKLQKEIAQQISLHKSPPVDPNQIPLL